MDLVSWIFGNGDYDQDTKIYIDPENHQRSISANEARTYVRRFVAGWKAVGLKPGDCVCVHAFNDVRTATLSSHHSAVLDLSAEWRALLEQS